MTAGTRGEGNWQGVGDRGSDRRGALGQGEGTVRVEEDETGRERKEARRGMIKVSRLGQTGPRQS